MSKNRSADAGILGFTYQFLQTAIKILEHKDDNTVFTIEGIEDLDISKSAEHELVQYKYHELTKYTPSVIQKPIALMFKHFKDNFSEKSTWNIKYNLFCYFGVKDQKTQIDSNLIENTDQLKTILNYKKAKKILGLFEWDQQLAERFLTYLKFSNADQFEVAEKNLISILSDIFKVKESESEIHYFPNAMTYINILATKRNMKDRKITKKKFYEHLKHNSKKFENSILQRIYGKRKYIQMLKKYLISQNIQKNSSSHIFYISESHLLNARFITNISKKFLVQNKKKDTYPILIIVNSEYSKLIKLKEKLSEINVKENQNLIFNDGDEDYYFNLDSFNASPLIELQKNHTMIKRSSYNYKIISYENFNKNKNNIHFNNPIHIFTDNSDIYSDLFNDTSFNKLILADATEEEILDLFGG